MATLADLIANVIKIRGFIGVYLDVPTLSPKQKAALKTNLGQLDRNLAALAAFIAEPVAVVPVAKVLADKVPDFGVRPEMSSALYGEWVAAWWVTNFGGLASVDYGQIVGQAKADGCLAQVCAAGKLGSPDGPVPDLGDWSLFTALTSTQDEDGLTHRVYHMGTLVGTQSGGDGLEFAHSLGFNW
jgi:hypothetical protein